MPNKDITTQKQAEQAEKTQSFLNEAQLAGKATGKVELKNVEDAMKEMTHILNKDVAKMYKEKDEKDWPTSIIALYCHDCRAIVPAGQGKTMRGKPRLVCGECKSKKVSKGREEVLRRHYHLEDKKDEKKDPAKKPAKA